MRREHGEPVAGARVILSDASTRRMVASDSLGAFAIDSLRPGRYAIGVTAVAFHALNDSIVVSETDGGALDIALGQAVMDGPCSGFAAMRVRKPWWKLW